MYIIISSLKNVSSIVRFDVRRFRYKSQILNKTATLLWIRGCQKRYEWLWLSDIITTRPNRSVIVTRVLSHKHNCILAKYEILDGENSKIIAVKWKISLKIIISN